MLAVRSASEFPAAHVILKSTSSTSSSLKITHSLLVYGVLSFSPCLTCHTAKTNTLFPYGYRVFEAKVQFDIRSKERTKELLRAPVLSLSLFLIPHVRPCAHLAVVLGEGVVAPHVHGHVELVILEQESWLGRAQIACAHLPQRPGQSLRTGPFATSAAVDAGVDDAVPHNNAPPRDLDVYRS